MSKPAPAFRYKPAIAIGWTDGSKTELEPFTTDYPNGEEAEHDQKQLLVVVVPKADFERLVKKARVKVQYSERSYGK